MARTLEDLPTEKATVKEAAKVLGGLEAALKDNGLDERFGKVRNLFDEQFEQVAEEFQITVGKAALLSNFTKKNLSAFVDERLLMASTSITAYIDDVRSVVLDAVVSGKRVDAKEIVRASSGKALGYVETEINTTLMAYQRILHQEKAKKAGITKFLYVGPYDDITREFCKDRVDKIYTAAEIEDMDNGSDLPVNVYCGGYNCRHHWRPVSDELADELEKED